MIITMIITILFVPQHPYSKIVLWILEYIEFLLDFSCKA